MSCKNTIKVIFALLIIGVLISGCVQQPKPKELNQRFSEFKTKFNEKKAQTYNVTEAEEFARKAKQAYDIKDYVTAKEFLDKAFEALKKATPRTTPKPTSPIPSPTPSFTPLSSPSATSPIPSPTPSFTPLSSPSATSPITSLKQIKSAILYERLNDNRPRRSIGEQIQIIKDTKAEFIFRTWWRDYPVPESSTDASGLFTSSQLSEAVSKYYTYENLKTATSEIKKEIPNLILCGAIPAQFLRPKDKNDITGEVFYDTRSMAFDPHKWGINQPRQGGTPDITNAEFQKLLLSYAQKQIDLGTDAIWIDLLFTQAERLKQMTGDPYHPAVKESYEAASKIVDEIHNYGYSKYGKYIYVGTWIYPAVSLPYNMPKLDFVTQNVMSSEVTSMQFNNNRWDTTIKDTKSNLGDIPVFAVLDWASGTGTGLGVFSQTLTSEKQKEFLRKADDFFTKKGIIFVYPVHGGFMGENAKILSFGNSKIYDSLAPEFQTYETIKELSK